MTMKYAIVASRKDTAGMNIAGRLIENYGFSKKADCHTLDNVELWMVDEDSINCEGFDEKTDADIIIFATKHQSAAGRNSLSVHVPGNWGKADLGGQERTLCVAPASLVKEMFIELNEQGAGLGWEITMECVHHGPLLKKPVMFIEIGSGDGEWSNPEAGKIIAQTIMNVLLRERKHFKTAIAFGGGHYPSEFNKVLLRTDYAIGQICPKYQLGNIDHDLMKQAIEKNVEDVGFVILDWKGLGEHKDRIKLILDEIGIEYMKVRKILKEN